MELAVAVRIASEFTGRVRLSVFPYLLERLIHTRHEPSVNLPALSRLIRMDPALCFRAIRLDRSMGSHARGAPSFDIDDVVNRIGFAGIDAITAQALTDQVLNASHYHQGLALGWLWRHSLATALLAQGLAVALDFHPLEDAYIAGLLHNIGKLALFARTPAACAPMLSDPTQANALLEAEAKVAGSGHEQIGAWQIRRYTGSWSAADAAMYHTANADQIKNALPLVQIIWAAKHLADAPYPPSHTCRVVATILNLELRQLDHLSHLAGEQAKAFADELGVLPHLPEKSRDTDPHPMSQRIEANSVLSSVYNELLTSDDRNAIIRVLRQSLSVFLGLDTLIWLDHAPDSDHLTGRYATGNASMLPVDRMRIPLAARDCLPIVCHVTGQTVDSFSPVHPAKLTIIDRQVIAVLDTDGMVCMPLQSEPGRVKACLILGIDSSDWPWIKQQATLLQAIGTAVAGALARRRRQHDQINRMTADGIASTISRTRKIVHEINNPLSIIKNYLNVLTLHADEDPSGMDELRIIDEEINRVAGLIQSLTSSSETIPKQLETVDVNATVMDILDLFRESLPDRTSIRLNQDLDTHIPAITSDRDCLKQALINLLKNAMEAMLEGGTISVSTRMLKNLLQQNGNKDKAGHIQISVCDSGPGIDESIKNDLFKPHVTSKTGHDGLGLTIVHEAVMHLKGALFCESTSGRGTCFHIELPAGNNGSKNTNATDSVI